jgi:hypothetical protein
MNKLKDNVYTGLFCGFAAPAIAFLIYAKIKQPDEAVMAVIKEFIHLKIVTVILSFAAFVNLLVFFAFIWIKSDKSARGVLSATIIYAFLIIILKFSA